FYLFWARRKAEFPTSRAAALRDCSTAKLSAAEAPAIHDGWPTPMVPRAERDEARRDAVELRQERDEARRERDNLRARLANVITYLNGCKNLEDALRDVALLDRASCCPGSPIRSSKHSTTSDSPTPWSRA